MGFGTGGAGDANIGGTEKLTGVRLASDFSFAETPGGEKVPFTRSERLALAMLAQHPNRLLSRDQILDALTGPGSDKSDRNNRGRWWAHQDSNLEPDRYERSALTIEL